MGITHTEWPQRHLHRPEASAPSKPTDAPWTSTPSVAPSAPSPAPRTATSSNDRLFAAAAGARDQMTRTALERLIVWLCLDAAALLTR